MMLPHRVLQEREATGDVAYGLGVALRPRRFRPLLGLLVARGVLGDGVHHLLEGHGSVSVGGSLPITLLNTAEKSNPFLAESAPFGGLSESRLSGFHHLANFASAFFHSS